MIYALFLLSIFIVFLIYSIIHQKDLINTQENKQHNILTEDFSSQKQPVSFTMFYVDWCPHCSSAKPEFEKLKSLEKINKTKINYKSVNGEKNPEAIKEQDIDGYPTFILNINDTSHIYQGERTFKAFKKYLNDMLL